MGISQTFTDEDLIEDLTPPVFCEWHEGGFAHCRRIATTIIYFSEHVSEERYCDLHGAKRIVQILEATNRLRSDDSDDYLGCREYRL